MKRNSLTLTIGALLILIVVLLLFMFQVRKSEVAVITTFGKPTRQIMDPGAYLKWPWPIQNVHKFDQRAQNFEAKLTEGQTADSFNLLTSVYVGWRITQPKDFFPKFAGNPDPIAEAERVLDRLVGNAKAAVISKHPLGDFLAPAGGGNKFAEIENEVLAAVRQDLRSQSYGVEIEFLGIKKLGLPEPVTQQVFERMTSERQVLISKSQFEGEAEAQKIRSEAERKAADMLSDADSEAMRIRARGEAQALQSLAIFQKNPELATFIFRLNALESSLKEKSVLILDQSIPPFDLFRWAATNISTRAEAR